MTSLTVTLPVPSRNTGGNARGHAMEIHRERTVAKANASILLREAMHRNALYGDVRWGRVRIAITWIYSNARHRPDPDNAISRCKPYIDACTAVGLIVDDSPDHVVAVEINYERGPIANVRMQIDRLHERNENTA